MQGLLNKKSLMCKGYSESNASYSIMSAMADVDGMVIQMLSW